MKRPIAEQNSIRLNHFPFYTEGPVADNTGNCYFTSLTGGIIYQKQNDGKLLEWAKAACPNGQIILPNGDHLVCDVKLVALSRFSSEGHFLGNDMQDNCAGVTVYSPNDLIVDSSGGIYFTDSVRHEGKVAYIGIDGYEHIVAEQLDYPNGLALSRDERFLFIAESYKNRILIFSLKTGGVVEGRREVFAELPENAIKDISKNLPDGIKVDVYGNIWVAHYGMGAIQVLNPQGILVQTIQTDIPLTSNLCLTDTAVIITGGFGEPGPGAVSKIFITYEEY